MKKILWITRMAPADIDSAGLILQYRYLEILSKYYDVTVLSMKEDYGTNPLLKLKIKAIKYKDFAQLYQILSADFDIAVFNWWDIAHNFLQKIRRHVKKIIINTVDVEFVRNMREHKLGRQVDLKDIVHRKQKEIQTYSWADKLWFVTENDKIEAEKELPVPKKNDVLPIIQKLRPEHEIPRTRTNKNYVYMIGNFLHSPNVDSAIILCRDIFPRVLEKNPAMHLWIFGKWPPAELRKFNSENIHITGIVYDLEKRLKTMEMCVAYLRYGAGLKGKVCEAMSYGIPVIGTPVAFEGLNVNDENAIVVNSVDETAEAINDLYFNEEKRKHLGINGYNLIKEFSYENVETKLINSIEELEV